MMRTGMLLRRMIIAVRNVEKMSQKKFNYIYNQYKQNMEKEKMTIHRALTELKMIGKRLEDKIGSIVPLGLAQEGKLINGLHERKEFEKNAKSRYQSVMDLIDRKARIKKAVLAANSKTKVKIAGKSMTIADAIHAKEIIGFKHHMLNSLEELWRRIKAEAERKNEKVDKEALDIAIAALKKDNVKIGDKDAVAITEPYRKVNTYHIVDPLDAEKVIEDLKEEVDQFEAEVDAVLSEVNATTFIEF